MLGSVPSRHPPLRRYEIEHCVHVKNRADDFGANVAEPAIVLIIL